MARTLDVYLHDLLVGHLIQDDGGQMVFEYAEKPQTYFPLSHSLPFRKERFKRNECRGFFAGLLPEEGNRETIARKLGVSPQNDYAILDGIGGECAGAVTFVPAGEPLPKKNYGSRSLTDKELAEEIRTLPRRPLMVGEEGIRLSLAGAQDKMAVLASGENISLSLGGAPTSHIIKPANERFEGVVFNEAVCMKLADKIRLPTAQVEIRNVEGIDYLLVERYDRKLVPIPPGGLFKGYFPRRLHQEDFCQALAVPPEMKYQREGGPSLKQCFDLLREVSDIPAVDLQLLLDAVIFNALIGNHDAHSKNFSLLYEEGTLLTGNPTRLAPLYDLVCTVYYPELSPKMAMKIGGESVSKKLMPKHFEKFAEETGLAGKLVAQRVPELAETILDGLNDIDVSHKVAREVISLIKKRCQLFRTRFKN